MSHPSLPNRFGRCASGSGRERGRLATMRDKRARTSPKRSFWILGEKIFRHKSVPHLSATKLHPFPPAVIVRIKATQGGLIMVDELQQGYTYAHSTTMKPGA